MVHTSVYDTTTVCNRGWGTPMWVPRNIGDEWHPGGCDPPWVPAILVSGLSRCGNIDADGSRLND